MRLFLSVGNQNIESIVEESNLEIVDREDDLETLYDELDHIIDYVGIDGLIVNRLLDNEEGGLMLRIAKKAKKRNIKVLVLTEELDSYNERKVVTNLVSQDVTAFLKFKEITSEKIEEVFMNYPSEFDFNIFSETIVEYREVVKSVFKKVIAVYSPMSDGTSTVASHLAHAIAENNQCRVCLLDFNILRPRVKDIFNMTFDYSLEKLLDEASRRKLSSTVFESYAKESKYLKGLDVFGGMENLNEIYQIREEEFREIIEKAKFAYDYVVIDTHSFYDLPPTHVALRMADEIIIPIRGRDYSIKTLKKYCESFERYDDFKTNKFKVVVNKFSGEDLTSIEIQAKIKYPVIGYVSYAKEYDKLNAFKDSKLIREYDTILRKLDIEVEGTKRFNFKNIIKGVLKR